MLMFTGDHTIVFDPRPREVRKNEDGPRMVYRNSFGRDFERLLAKAYELI